MPDNTCAKCGADIRFVATERGYLASPPKLMPIDRQPVEDGNVIIIPPDGAIPALAHVLKKGEQAPEGQARFKSHFATCPFARDFRR